MNKRIKDAVQPLFEENWLKIVPIFKRKAQHFDLVQNKHKYARGTSKDLFGENLTGPLQKMLNF